MKITYEQEKIAHDRIIDNHEGGFYKKTWAPIVLSKYKFDMGTSGTTMFGFDFDASQMPEVVKRIEDAFARHGYPIEDIPDDEAGFAKFYNDKADGKRSFPAALGTEIREILYPIWLDIFNRTYSTLPDLDISDEMRFLLLYATYAQLGLPQSIKKEFSKLPASATDEEQYAAYCKALAMFPNAWYVDGISKRYGLTERVLAQANANIDVCTYMLNRYRIYKFRRNKSTGEIVIARPLALYETLIEQHEDLWNSVVKGTVQPTALKTPTYHPASDKSPVAPSPTPRTRFIDSRYVTGWQILITGGGYRLNYRF